MKEKLQKFFWGRYGSDELNRDIVYVEFVLIAISIFSDSRIWILLFDILVFYSFYRMLSKDIYKRYEENRKYQFFKKKTKHKIQAASKNLKDKEHKYFVCEKCTQIIRIPRGKGEIVVSCPNCREKFEKRT